MSFGPDRTDGGEHRPGAGNEDQARGWHRGGTHRAPDRGLPTPSRAKGRSRTTPTAGINRPTPTTPTTTSPSQRRVSRGRCSASSNQVPTRVKSAKLSAMPATTARARRRPAASEGPIRGPSLGSGSTRRAPRWRGSTGPLAARRPRPRRPAPAPGMTPVDPGCVRRSDGLRAALPHQPPAPRAAPAGCKARCRRPLHRGNRSPPARAPCQLRTQLAEGGLSPTSGCGSDPIRAGARTVRVGS